MDEAYEGGGADTGGEVGAAAVCNTGFCTCVLLTDCIIMGVGVLACLAVCPPRGNDTGDIEAGGDSEEGDTGCGVTMGLCVWYGPGSCGGLRRQSCVGL